MFSKKPRLFTFEMKVASKAISSRNKIIQSNLFLGMNNGGYQTIRTSNTKYS
ncbi:hypothetical protein Hanom_Chr08g00700521 [Helianthus anomalus]